MHTYSLQETGNRFHRQNRGKSALAWKKEIVSNKLDLIKFSLASPEEWFVCNTVKLVFSGWEGGLEMRNTIFANVGLPIVHYSGSKNRVGKIKLM